MLNYHYILRMKTRTSIILFILAGIFLTCVFFATKKFINRTDNSITRAKIINPKVNESDGTKEDISNIESQVEKFESLIELKPSETLISSLTMDFNADTFEDEVVVVRKIGDRNFYIIPGLYNQETMTYERMNEIRTKISSTKTFSINFMDIIGDHRNALIYQGIDEFENSIMQIFNCEYVDGELEFVCIGDFISDGTIFVQQTDRSDSYEHSMSKGESFSVWLYKSEEEENSNAQGLNQIQQEYKWNPLAREYQLFKETKVAESKIAQTELSKIQDGTVETFAAFLNGLWEKTSNTDSNFRYFYFDYDNKEIIQYYGDIQEIYIWEVSRVRHNGIYISTVNFEISNLHRRIDISLLSTDQIRLTTRDDVNLIIKEDTLWDGTYKKLNLDSVIEDTKKVKQNAMINEIEKTPIWNGSDGSSVISFEDSVFIFKRDEIEEKGVYSIFTAGNYTVLQLRSNSIATVLGTDYTVEYGTKIEKEKQVTDYDTIILTPVKVSPTDCFAIEGEILTFSRQQ